MQLCANSSSIMTRNIAIFASGAGSNAENIVSYFHKADSARVRLILSNKPDALVLERAGRLGVPALVFAKGDWASGEKILSVLQDYQIDFIVLAGFLLHIPNSLLHVYPDRIINIHPSLLPKHGGKGMYGDKVHEAVVAGKEEESGITIHYVNANYDEGKIIRQVSCVVLPGDSPADVAAKVHALEYEYYPQVIEQLVLSL